MAGRYWLMKATAISNIIRLLQTAVVKARWHSLTLGYGDTDVNCVLKHSICYYPKSCLDQYRVMVPGILIFRVVPVGNTIVMIVSLSLFIHYLLLQCKCGHFYISQCDGVFML